MQRHNERKRPRLLGLLLVVIAIAILFNVTASFVIPYIVGWQRLNHLVIGDSFSRPPSKGSRGNHDDGDKEVTKLSFEASAARRRGLNVLRRDREEDDDAFCDSMRGGMAPGSAADRVMVHVLVSNSGHFPFLHNIILSVIRSGLDWRPVVLAIGSNVCPMIENQTELVGKAVCVPYLERLLRQLARDEPESMQQIKKENVVADHGDNVTKIFETIDSTFYGWGGVEHKFLINAKLYALRDVLNCGFDAFLTDTDVGFRRDPRPYFDVGDGPEGDVLAQNDTNPSSYPLNINSGFMYWRWTDSNLRLVNDIITVPPFWHIDQARVNLIMLERGTPHTILDEYKFPNGHMFLEHFDELDDEVVAFHANYNDRQGQKEGMLRKMGLWHLR